MDENIRNLFKNEAFVRKIKEKLPKLFHLAELESSRAGKVGMEVGSVREKIIASILINEFGRQNVETEIPITKTEIDVILFGNPISIKTITGKNFAGIKLIWTVDAEKVQEFSNKYKPSCDVVLIQINWDNGGGIYYVPLEVQTQVFQELGRENYLKLPKIGTNPRGVEMAANAMKRLVDDVNTFKIQLNWKKEIDEFNPFARWVSLWQED